MSDAGPDSVDPPIRDVQGFIRNVRSSFNTAVDCDQADVLGGFVILDESVHFVRFTPEVPGHESAIRSGLVPHHCVGGFSIGVRGRLVRWFLFRSVVNRPGIYSHPDPQHTIIQALPKEPRFEVFS